MKITSRMLPFEVVRAVRDDIEARVSADRRELNLLKTSEGTAPAKLLGAILRSGVEDREMINRAIDEGTISPGRCYDHCHHCCRMSITYEVEVFDILLSYMLNTGTVQAAFQAGKLDEGREWCGLLETGLCSIHHYKPYSCLLTLPSPKGAARGGCYFRGDRNAQTMVHRLTMVVTGRMRMLFREYLPELPEFAGSSVNQAFRWAVKQVDAPLAQTA